MSKRRKTSTKSKAKRKQQLQGYAVVGGIVGFLFLASAADMVGGKPISANAAGETTPTQLASSTHKTVDPNDGCLAQAKANYRARFRGSGLVRSIAQVRGEAGPNCPTTATLHNGGGKGTDRGPWQYNSVSHPEVSESCARNRKCSAEHAFDDTNHGENFGQWYAPQTPWMTYAQGLATEASK